MAGACIDGKDDTGSEAPDLQAAGVFICEVAELLFRLALLAQLDTDRPV